MKLIALVALAAALLAVVVSAALAFSRGLRARRAVRRARRSLARDAGALVHAAESLAQRLADANAQPARLAAAERELDRSVARLRVLTGELSGMRSTVASLLAYLPHS